MPKGFTWPRHAHRQRQQAQHGRVALVVMVDHGPVDPHARVMIDIAGLGKTHNGMDE